jgi:hypothetical protein
MSSRRPFAHRLTRSHARVRRSLSARGRAMPCVPLPDTSHDPAVRARPTVGPEDLSRPSHLKHLGSRTQSMSDLPCDCCRVLYHRGPQVCGEHVWGSSWGDEFQGASGVSTFWWSGGGLCVSMKLQDRSRSTQHNTWCVRISQHTGWSIIIKAAHGCTTVPPHSYSRVWP